MTTTLERKEHDSPAHTFRSPSWDLLVDKGSFYSDSKNPVLRLAEGRTDIYPHIRVAYDAFSKLETIRGCLGFSLWLKGNQTVEEYYRPLPRGSVTNATENLRHRLANANDHYRRKASEVYNDKAALGLLREMYTDVVVNISDFDACETGIPLAKLTAANFCEVGAKVIYITEAGQRFIDSLGKHGRI